MSLDPKSGHERGSDGGEVPCDCEKDPIAALKALFVDRVQQRRIEEGQEPARRPVFLRLHGAARGTFVVREDLPEELRVGVFARREPYPAWVRFSSDIPDGVPDLKSTVGIGIKLFDVPGEKLLAPDQDAITHDFILQNFDVFFVDDALEMCRFTQASLDGKIDDYFAKHPETKRILDEMAQVVPTVLGASYWSVLPFGFGDGRYVKYKLEPVAVPPGDSTPDLTDPFYLGADLHLRLQRSEARFRFLVQFQTSEQEMPLDRATVRWSETASHPLHVATLILPAQDVRARGQATYGENLAYNIWHALPEHTPVGSLAEARKVVYQAAADLRRNVNGVPLGEPAAPRPQDDDAPVAKADTRVVRAAIHPAIGVARVGNSDESFVGPEVIEPEPQASGFYRDGAGALKRQAARFRIYGYNAAGEVVRELTPDDASIRWTVHVANKKAAWYRFKIAMDIPEAAEVSVPRRNASLKGPERQQLVIDPGPRSIAGKDTQGKEYQLDSGTFMGKKISLGELRTDDKGHLLFLGGLGVSASPTGAPIYDPEDPDTFPNADGWYDDIADGPVTAEVAIAGTAIPTAPAWVISAPPNYAPEVIAVRTLYDLLYDEFVRAGWLAFPDQVSFTRDVYPILQRLSGLQWVNKGFAAQFGWGGPNRFTEREHLTKLASRSDTSAELRRQVLNAFRGPHASDANPWPWPWIYGDAMDVPAADTPRQNMSLSPTQYRLLQLWAAGEFADDWQPDRKPPRTLDEVPLAEQPAMLDQAALHFCIADAFHPGCELTWPMRHSSMFEAPFRIRARAAGQPEPDYGDNLTAKIALEPDGPLYAQGPGDLTRWMAVPWQMDTAMCRSGYEPDYDPFLPTFWPARVPNQVLAEADYAVVVNEQAAHDERLAAFARRQTWTRPLTGSAVEQMTKMVSDFGKLGVVEVRPGVAGDPDFPPVMMVESLPAAPVPPPEGVVRPAPAVKPPVRETRPSAGEVLRRRALAEAGWESEAVAAEFIAILSGARHRG